MKLDLTKLNILSSKARAEHVDLCIAVTESNKKDLILSLLTSDQHATIDNNYQGVWMGCTYSIQHEETEHVDIYGILALTYVPDNKKLYSLLAAATEPKKLGLFKVDQDIDRAVIDAFVAGDIL